jgi:hypothetical protein
MPRVFDPTAPLVCPNARYTKVGATFADAEAAKADKNRLFSPELAQSVKDCYDSMLANGIFYEPVLYGWDQTTYTLTVVKFAHDVPAYKAAITFDVAATIRAAEAAGWTYIPS